MYIEQGSIEYQVLDECKCGPEEFFVLVSSIEDSDFEPFLEKLVRLVKEQYLQCDQGQRERIDLSIADLRSYVDIRRNAGEDLEQHPAVCEEYRFTTTEQGLGILVPEDRPIPV
jgi:hypothetical protein